MSSLVRSADSRNGKVLDSAGFPDLSREQRLSQLPTHDKSSDLSGGHSDKPILHLQAADTFELVGIGRHGAPDRKCSLCCMPLPPLYCDRPAPVAQLERAPDYEWGGQDFESLRARHKS